jgi:ketosteroid isomerase-like protein
MQPMTENIEHEILTQEENLTQATRNLDIEALESFYADDILATGVTGEICSKTFMIEEARRGITQRESAIASGKKFVSSYDKEDLKVASHGDVAIASYRFVVNIKGEGIDVNRRYRTTNVWMKRQARWQVIAAHTASLELDLSKL